jgi:hypothetical protein
VVARRSTVVIRSDDEYTPVYHIEPWGNRALVDLLLSHGANPNAHVEASGNAVYAGAGFPEIRTLLEAHGETVDPYDLSERGSAVVIFNVGRGMNYRSKSLSA